MEKSYRTVIESYNHIVPKRVKDGMWRIYAWNNIRSYEEVLAESRYTFSMPDSYALRNMFRYKHRISKEEWEIVLEFIAYVEMYEDLEKQTVKQWNTSKILVLTVIAIALVLLFWLI